MFSKYFKNGWLRKFAASGLTAVFTVGSFGSCTCKATQQAMTPTDELFKLVYDMKKDGKFVEPSFKENMLAVSLAVLIVVPIVVTVLLCSESSSEKTSNLVDDHLLPKDNTHPCANKLANSSSKPEIKKSFMEESPKRFVKDPRAVAESSSAIGLKY